MMRRFWTGWELSERETAYAEALERALETIISIGRIEAIYVGGSFIRRELHETSDIDVWTITSEEQTLERVRALDDDTQPHVSYHGFTIDELERGTRTNTQPGQSSVKRFVAAIPDLELVYGSLDTSGMPALTRAEDLGGRLKGWPIMLDAYENASMTFPHLAKYLCWIAIANRRLSGEDIERVDDLKDASDHVVPEAVAWSRNEPCDDEKAAIEAMHAYVLSIHEALCSPSSIEELTALLTAHDVSGGIKGTGELFSELTNGESTLRIEDDRLVRSVRTAAVHVRSERGLLYEASYERSGDTIMRELPWSIAEKLVSGESFEDAANRGLREELGVSAELEFVAARTTRGESPAYRGLELENGIVEFRCWLDTPRETYVEETDGRRIVWRWHPDAD